ncbi:Regulator of sigma-E protease RseP [Planctomycetes bacterium MalM25]|nr:Regulator of sigma-E protease RseP [Planctomycetes bacterium MalM25]
MQTLSAILQVALGLGFVIFVHELGHFLVAKACGVRCDKFFVGFDIGGLKISRKWGETEYGIGALPLGGYVKMFGQDDNVANIAEEMERSRALEGSPDAKEVTAPDGSKIWIDKRSYLAKSVPQRMAIISAGVIMNIIFAGIMAWIAFGVGVPESPAVVGGVLPGAPAWEAGLKTGDRFTRVNEIENPSYQELTEEVVLGDVSKGVDCVIQSANGTTRDLVLKPRKTGKMPQIGVLPSTRPFVAAKDAVIPFTPAAELGDAGFHDGDQIVAIGARSIDSYADLAAVLQTRMDEPLEYTVVRGGKPPKDDPYGDLEGGERVSFTVGPNAMERLGIVPRLGPIVSVAADSPAAAAGLKAGDRILAVDGVAIGVAPEGEEAIDPVLLESRLAAVAERGEEATLRVERGEETLDLAVTPRVVDWRTTNLVIAPKAYDTLGVACEVASIVDAIIGGSAAASADLKVGDRILKATLRSENPNEKLSKTIEIDFDAEAKNWSALLDSVQDRSPDFVVELLLVRSAKPGAEASGGDPTHTIELKPAAVADAYTPARGVSIQPLERLGIAGSMAEQTQLAWDSVTRNLTTVLRFLQGLGSGQVSASGAGGPIAIAQGAGAAANAGFGSLLMFLVMLSANLAVLNFLPIPVLDGGHMVFLLYEGITGRPVNERVMIALQMVGLFLLLGLMLYVTTNDISRLFTRLF